MSEVMSFSLVAFSEMDVRGANGCLTDWGHYLGPCNRPFGQQAWALRSIREIGPLAVAISASTVSATVAGFGRREVVELARLCRRPGPEWAWTTRVMLRLWREAAVREWPYWPVKAAVAYSQNGQHSGQIYRTDGWEKVREDAGTSRGGGNYSTKRESDDPATGPKTLWVWRYQ